MPELPEVETVKNALKKALEQRTIKRVFTYIEKMRYPLKPLEEKKLTHHTIVDVRRRGRYIICELENYYCFLVHLGMSGSMRVVEKDIPRKKHEHVVIELDNNLSWRFDCPRRFGFMNLEKLPAKGADPLSLNKLGPEPFDKSFSGKYLYDKFNKRKAKIKNILMDNTIVVGVGNIYVNEVLFRCRINPLTEAGKISKKKCGEIASVIKEILTEAISQGGTTIADFKGVDGSEGKFVQQLNIYGKAGKSCPLCDSVIAKTVIGGRSSFYCPSCQKENQ